MIKAAQREISSEEFFDMKNQLAEWFEIRVGESQIEILFSMNEIRVYELKSHA